MSKKNQKNTQNTPNTTAPKKRTCWNAIGGFLFGTLKITGLVSIIGAFLFVVLFNISFAMVKSPSPKNTFTVASFNVERNTVNLENADGVTEVYLLGIVLDAENPDINLDKYVGAEVYLESETLHGDYTEDGIRQAYIIVLNSDHVLQMDMLIDDVAYLGDMHKLATHYSAYQEAASFGIYPVG